MSIDPEHQRVTHEGLHLMPNWVIYRPVTSDHPGKWVGRLHFSLPEPRPTNLMFLADSLEEARSKVPQGLVCIARDKLDDRVIEEIWL